MKTNKEMTIRRSVIKASVSNTITSFIAIINVHKVAAIAIYASDFLFVNYKSGVVSNCGTGSIDHAVTLVGYIIDHNTSTYVWIIKNSWGVRWGEFGYVRMSMD
jgi:C1A family cysteine protease